jgi:phosphoribosylanthranilate isomerase
MAFAVIPALDVAGGRLVAWSAGGATPVEAFGGDPLAAAEALAAQGARWMHVADLDLAFAGEPAGIEVVRSLRAALPGCRLQASGGIAAIELVGRYLAAGADRVVVGSAALADQEGTQEVLERYRDAVILGIEVQGGQITARGREPVELDLMVTLGWLAAARSPGFLVTAVSNVGGLAGPDLDTVRRVVRSGVPVFAAGGISSLSDLRALREAGAVGAVVGRAALEGSLDLAETFQWASGA